MTEGLESAPGPWTLPVRQRSWRGVVGAFLLNLILPPVGYVFVGRWKLALAFLALLAGLATAALAWTFQSPPGLYRWLIGPSSYLTASWSVSLPLAIHAAWIAYKAPLDVSARRPGMLIHLAFAASPLILVALIRAFLPLAVYQIPSVAMSPTLEPGEIIGVDGARALCGSVTPVVGDVVVHRKGATRFVKRVVAGPGQLVAMRNGVLIVDGQITARKVEGEAPVIENGPFSVTGQIVRETLPGGRSYRTLDLAPDTQFDNYPATRIPAGTWFAMGDNRDNSLDSRATGPVAQKDVCGVVTKVLVSKNLANVGARP